MGESNDLEERWHTDTEDTDTHTLCQPVLASPGHCVSRTNSRQRRTSLEHVVSCTVTCAPQKLQRHKLRRSFSRISALPRSALPRLQSNPGAQQQLNRFMHVRWRSTVCAMLRPRQQQLQQLMRKPCSNEQLKPLVVQRRHVMPRWQQQRRRQQKLAKQKLH